MSPFLASKSSAGNKKRLAGYYRKNKVKPILDEGIEPPSAHDRGLMTTQYAMEPSMLRNSLEVDSQNNMSSLFYEGTVNQKSDRKNKNPVQDLSSMGQETASLDLSA